jgi:hypothetical protein
MISNNSNNNDRFESDIDILIEEIMRRSKNQEQLQKEIDINQKKLEELSKTTRNMQLNEMFENELKKYQQTKNNNNNNNKSVTPIPTPVSSNNNNKVKESLSPIAENELEFIYSTIEKYDSNDDFNIQKSESNFSLNELQELIKTATHTNENLDMEFIKNFFQSEISNCIKNSDNDKELQVSLNKMLQDFLICLQTNLAEIQKKQQPLITNNNNNNNSSNYRTKVNNNSNNSNYQLIDPETDEKQVEVVFQNIYKSHALTHVCWGKYIFIFVSCFKNFLYLVLSVVYISSKKIF